MRFPDRLRAAEQLLVHRLSDDAKRPDRFSLAIEKLRPSVKSPVLRHHVFPSVPIAGRRQPASAGSRVDCWASGATALTPRKAAHAAPRCRAHRTAWPWRWICSAPLARPDEQHVRAELGHLLFDLRGRAVADRGPWRSKPARRPRRNPATARKERGRQAMRRRTGEFQGLCRTSGRPPVRLGRLLWPSTN